MTEVDINVRIRKFLSSALRDIGAGNYDGAIEHLRAAVFLYPFGVYHKAGVFHMRQNVRKRYFNFTQQLFLAVRFYF